jgi:hypothetical protein
VEVLQVSGARLTGRALLGLCAALALGCGPKVVDGSLSVLMDMRYETSEVVLGQSDLTVRFVRPSTEDGQGEDLVLAVAARGLAFPLLAPPPDGVLPITIDLAEQTGFGQRGALSRNVLGDPRRTFLELERGRILLNREPVAGERVSGEFSVTFVRGTEFGSGRTLFESFEGMVR